MPHLIGERIQNPENLFKQNMDLETPLIVGDWQTHRIIDAVSDGGLVTYDQAPFHFQPFLVNEHGGFDT